MRMLIQRAAVLATVLLCGLAGVACVAYWQSGGNGAALADAIVGVVQGEGMPALANGESWTQSVRDLFQQTRDWALSRTATATAESELALPQPGPITEALVDSMTESLIEPPMDRVEDPAP